MPFCQNCGRPLAEGEVCNCRNMQGSPQPSPYMRQPYPQGQPAPQGQNAYQQLYQPGQQPQKKDNKFATGCLIAVIVGAVLLPVLGVLVAIFVPAMIGYTTKARVTEANASAKSCYQAASAALAELGEARLDVGGYYILTNIPGKEDVNAPSDVQTLHTAIDKYYPYADEYAFFVVVEGYQVTYVAVQDDQHPDTIGTYPRACEARSAADYFGEQHTIGNRGGNEMFDQLFKIACEALVPAELPGDVEDA